MCGLWGAPKGVHVETGKNRRRNRRSELSTNCQVEGWKDRPKAPESSGRVNRPRVRIGGPQEPLASRLPCLCRCSFGVGKIKRGKRPNQPDGEAKKLAEIAELRKRIGWLSDELRRRHQGTRPTLKQVRNLRCLEKVFRDTSTTNQRIKLEKLKGLSTGEDSKGSSEKVAKEKKGGE